MNNKKTLDLIVFLRFSARKPENVGHDIESVLELFDTGRIPKEIPLHWNFPVSPVLTEMDGENSEQISIPTLIHAVKARLATRKDMLIPMGYGGAYHSLLTDEELRQEVEWTFSNPWNHGFQDVFGFKPRLMMPSQMDFFRPSSRSLYNSTGLTWLAAPDSVTFRRKDKYLLEKLEIIDHGNIYSLPLLRFTSPAEDIVKDVKTVFRKSISPLAVLIDFIHGNTAEDLGSLVETLKRTGKRTDVQFVPISRWLLPDQRQKLHHLPHNQYSTTRVPGTIFPGISFSHNPADRRKRLEAGKKRFFIQSNDIGKDSTPYIEGITRANGMYKRSETLDQRINPALGTTPVDRSLIADMPGTVVLKEKDFEAEFRNGRFSNIISERGPLLAGMETQSYITINGKNFPFENAGVYSFESEEIRGLREILSLETPFTLGEGNLVIDYMFIHEHPSLFISVDIRYPKFTTLELVDKYAPLEIPLFKFNPDDTLSATGIYPDDTSYTIELPREDTAYDLPGRRFIFNKNETAFIMSFPPINEQQIVVVPMKAETVKHEGKMSINPKGSYHPTASQFISGFSEHFTIMISAVEGSIREEPIPPQVLEQLQQSWLGKWDN